MGEKHLFPLPGAVGIERHVFDEPHFDARLPGEMAEWHNLLFGQAADRDGVHLDRMKADALRLVNSGPHFLVAFAARDLL